MSRLILAGFLYLRTFASGKDVVTFLDREFRSEQWRAIQYKIKCWNMVGHWVKSSPHHRMYTSTCISTSRYINDACGSTNRTYYHWDVESACGEYYQHWSSAEMCHLLSDRSIMFVGDSITEEFYYSFLSALHFNESCDPSPQKIVDCSSGRFRISNVRNDRLSITIKGANPLDYELMWAPRLNDENVSLVVLNRGAHYVSDDVLIQEINETMSYLVTNHRNISIIFRSTHVGHKDFEASFFSPPLAIPMTLPVDWYVDWHYADFLKQNRMVEEFLSQQYPQVLYIDVYPSTTLRADGHCDNLHYCIPGPIDNWVRYFFNAVALVSRY